MDQPENKQLVEVGVSYRFAQQHGWVVNAVTGFLSAYYMEDPRFRFKQRRQELETGMHLWVCEIEDNMRVYPLVKRLQLDLPPSQIQKRDAPADGRLRYVIDLPEASTEQA